MDYLRELLGMPSLTVNVAVYYSITILLIIISVFFILRGIVTSTMDKYGSLSFYIMVVPLMLIFIPQFGKEVPIDLWLFGAALGTFIGLTFFSTTFKKKNAIFILIYGVIGIVIALVCEKFIL